MGLAAWQHLPPTSLEWPFSLAPPCPLVYGASFRFHLGNSLGLQIHILAGTPLAYPCSHVRAPEILRSKKMETFYNNLLIWAHCKKSNIWLFKPLYGSVHISRCSPCHSSPRATPLSSILRPRQALCVSTLHKANLPKQRSPSPFLSPDRAWGADRASSQATLCT